MTEEVSANPPGAESGPLNTVDQIAERLRGMPGREATDETSAGVEETQAETEQVEAEPEETTDPPEPDEPEEQPKGRYRVKINGEERLVTFDELRKGYQLESDYRQKTSKLAEERKVLEAERTHNAEILKGIIPALQVQLQDKFATVNWQELAKTDPAQYVALRAEFDQAAVRLNMALAEQKRIEDEQTKQRQAEHKEKLKAEGERLAEILPDYVHPEKGKTIRAELKSFLTESGYSAEEIGSLADHRAVLIAYKASQYDKAQKKAKEAAKSAKPVPQVQKPGNVTRADPKSAAVSAATERFSKSGRVDDLAAVLRARRATS